MPDTNGLTNIPTSRVTERKNKDGVRPGPEPSERTAYPTLPVNPARGLRSWDFLDSFGNKIGTVAQDGGNKRVLAFDAAGQLIGASQKPSKKKGINAVSFRVQGPGCMAGGFNKSDYYLVSFSSGTENLQTTNLTGPASDASSKYIGIRAFLPKEAVPSRARVSNSKLYCFNKFTRLLPPVVAPATPPTIPVPTFTRALPKYQGQSTAKRGCAKFNVSITSSTCGTPYANYRNFEYAPDLLYVEGSTTGIAGGGIVLGIVRTGAAYQRRDGIGYRDPNVPCGRNPAVRWAYGEFNLGTRKLFGWIPTQDTAGNSGDTRQC